MSKYRSLVKDVFIFALGSIGSKAIVFLLVPIYTNILTSEQYGTADLVLTISQLLMPIMSLAVYNAVMRYGLEKREEPEDTLLIGIIVWILGSILLLLLIPIINMYDSISKWKAYLYLYTSASILLAISQNYLKVKNQNFKYSLVSILQTAVLALSNIVFLVILKKDVQGYLFSNVIASILATLFAFISGGFITDLKKAHFDQGLLSNMLKYSAPLVLNNIAWWVIQSSDKIMIESFVGAAALGLYTVATRIPSLINVAVSVFQEAWNISSIVELDSEESNESSSSFYSNVFQVYTIGIFFVCIVINSLIKPFMRIYVGKEFFQSWTLIPLLVVSAAAFSAVSAFFGAIYGALKKSINNMLSTLLAGILNVVINALCIPYLGALGAIVGTLSAYFFLAMFRMIDILRFVKIKIDLKLYAINCILLIIDALFITLDFHIYIVSIITFVLFVIFNKTFMLLLITKTREFLIMRGKK